MRYFWILVLIGLGACGESQLVDVEGTGAAYNRSSTDPIGIVVDGKDFGTLEPGGTARFHFSVPVKGDLGLTDPGTSHTANVSVSFVNRRTGIPTRPASCSAGTATVTQMVYHPATSGSGDRTECWSSQSYDRLPKDSLSLSGSGR